jgi:hydrogenase/urease accessory protein HupE
MVPGVDNELTPPSLSDQNANQHSGLASNEADFFFTQPTMECQVGVSCHVANPAVPELSSVVLLSTCLLGVVLVTRRRLLNRG